MRHVLFLFVLVPAVLACGCRRKESAPSDLAARGPMGNHFDSGRRRGAPVTARLDGGTP